MLNAQEESAVREKLTVILAEVFKVSESSIKPDSKLSDLPNGESINIIRMIALIERTFDVVLPTFVAFHMDSVADITREIAMMQRAR
ncbi:acyl carrier protein [Streptomyces sp. NPDC057717]|uniref:acyl carrier protein n=1 Tax=Streptomyces sp. NPDC057717 TaxID=3346224 RepID=UPI0036CF1B2E